MTIFKLSNVQTFKFILTFTFLLHLSTSAAVPLKWTVETSRAQPATFEAYQGETLDFEATLQSYGKPLEAPVQYAFYWQTNGMGNAWWSVPVQGSSSSAGTGTSHSNCMHATWLPAYDVGAKAYNCFIGLSNSIYHAAFQLRLRPSPGAVPNELPLPQKVIDFSQVTVLNPPWSGGGGSGGVDTNAVIDIANDTIATNATISTLTSSVSALASSIASLESSKLDKTGGEIRGDGDNTGVLKIIRNYSEYVTPSVTINGSEIKGEYMDTVDLHFANGRVYYDELEEEDLMGSFMFSGAKHPIYINGVPAATTNDLALKADEFTPWIFGDGVKRVLYCNHVPDSDYYVFSTDPDYKGTEPPSSGTWYTEYVDCDATDIVLLDADDYLNTTTATRKRVLRTGDAATTNDLASAISTNNPAFVSAVQSISPPSSPTLRLYDEVRGCWWIGRMVNGIINWEVEE